MKGRGTRMLSKRLAAAFFLLCFVTFFGNMVAFADELADVQRKIKDKGFKWVAERLPNPEGKRLGLLRDGFMSPSAPLISESELMATLSPASLDWRNIGYDNLLGVAPGNYVSPVKNQGSCGSCWAFATTAVAESTTQIALNDPILASEIAYNLSEQVMLTCSGAGSCNGGYVSSASSYIATTGLLQEDPAGCYAYNYSSTTCPNPSSYPTCDQTRYRIDSWSGVSANVDAMKSALNNYGPLVTTYAVYNDFYRYYSSGIYAATSCDESKNPLVGYHAVALVGYEDATGDTPGYFIVKNSWGTSWGETAGGSERGYFKIAYSEVNNCVGFGGSTLAYSKNACNGIITVSSLGGLDTVQAGTTTTITWNAIGSVGQYVKIDLYRSGELIRTIQANAPLANGSYQWLVDSDLQGAGYSVMVTSTACSSAYGTSAGFTISQAATFDASGRVSSGASGISEATISFSRISGTGTVPAPVRTESSGNWSQTGFQMGTVYRATPSKQNTSFSPPFLDFSATSTTLNFTMIENKLVAVTSPVTGSTWKVGGTYTITWTYMGNPGSFVTIELSNSKTGAKTTITSKAKIGSGGIGSYSWRINKQQAAGNYQILVTGNTSDSSVESTVFSIIK